MRESRRIFRFAVIGTLNALIIAAVIWLMMDELDIDYMLSNITAYVIAQTHNFIWCKHWIFPLDDKERRATPGGRCCSFLSLSEWHIWRNSYSG